MARRRPDPIVARRPRPAVPIVARRPFPTVPGGTEDSRGNAYRGRRRRPRNPNTGVGQGLTVAIENLRERPVGDETPVGIQRNQPIEVAGPRPESMLDDNVEHDGTHLVGRLGVEHGKGLVEQQQLWG